MKNLSKEYRDWIIMIVIGAGLYFSGYHTEVIGQVQRVLIMTGALQPDLEAPDVAADANYNLKFSDVDGNIHNLSKYKGKTIFLNFWATWCPPCIAEMPDINNLYAELNDEVVFVLISIDEEEEKAWKFADRKGFDYPLYHIAGARPSVFQGRAIPSTFVIDPTGKIVMRREGMAKYSTDKFKAFLRGL